MHRKRLGNGPAPWEAPRFPNHGMTVIVEETVDETLSMKLPQPSVVGGPL